MTQRSLLVRALWFVFVGWWATPIVVNSAWLLNVTVILLPIGIKLINLVPTVLSLSRSHGRFQNPSRRGGNARSPSGRSTLSSSAGG